jgi:hypothetical protein
MGYLLQPLGPPQASGASSKRERPAGVAAGAPCAAAVDNPNIWAIGGMVVVGTDEPWGARRSTSNMRLVVAAEPAAALVVLLFAMDHCCGFGGRKRGAAAAAVVVVADTRGTWRIGARPALAPASAATQQSLEEVGMACLAGMEAGLRRRYVPREEEGGTPALGKIGMLHTVPKEEAGVLPPLRSYLGRQAQRQLAVEVLPAGVCRNSRSVRVSLAQL